jgi:sigma-B regulation protein RsbU (phosphoserine phosphatase)
MPFGIETDLPFDPVEPMIFEPGDVFLLLSDGYFEARSESGDMFGLDRVAQVVRSHLDKPAARILEEVRRAVIEHMGSLAADDDQTGVVVKRVR